MDFINWINAIIEAEKPENDIVAYYFGLFESSDVRYTLYLIGSEEFDTEDEDWACNDDFTPENNYLPLPEYAELKWEEVQENVVKLVKDFMETELYKSSFFSKAKAIAVGFDDGNLVLVKA